MRDRNHELRIATASIRLLYSSDVRLNGASYTRLPLLVDKSNDVIWAASDYFRFLAIKRGNAPGTIERKSLAIREWFEFLADQDVGWTDANDGLVQLWRNCLMAAFLNDYDEKRAAIDEMADSAQKELRRHKLGSRHFAEGRHRGVINYKLDSITHYYLWVQRNGYLDHRIIGVADLSRGLSRPPLTVDHGAKLDPSTGEILSETAPSPWRYVTSLQPQIDIPSRAEVEKVKDALVENTSKGLGAHNQLLAELLLERNALILDLAHFAQLRRFEITRVSIDDIPAAAAVSRHLESGRSFSLPVLGKGGKSRRVDIPPLLLEGLRGYVDSSRERFIDYIVSTGVARRRIGDEIFLSSQTGRALDVRSVSNLITDLRNLTSIDISCHKFRHIGITEFAGERRSQLRAANLPLDDSLLMVELKNRLGHSEKTDTARIYIHRAKLVEQAIATLGGDFDSEKQLLKGQLRILQARIELLQKRHGGADDLLD